MADRARHKILRRKVEAGRDSAPPDRVLLPVRALAQAMSRAAEETMSLAVTAQGVSERVASLSDLLEHLPENGLLAVLDGPEEGQGLIAFDSAAIASLIEKQMTGSVSRSPAPSRRVTRTDAALAADLIDAILRRFETLLAGREESRWAGGFGYGSHVMDLRPLGLLLEEIDYRIFGLTLDFETGTREGQMLLALPAEGRGEFHPLEDVAGAGHPKRDPQWTQRLEQNVLLGEIPLEAVLHRFQMSISAISALKPGDELPIPVSALDNVTLSGAETIPLGRCRLGRSRGVRALRIGADGEDSRGLASLDPAPDSRSLPPELPHDGPETLPDLSPQPTVTATAISADALPVAPGTELSMDPMGPLEAGGVDEPGELPKTG